jgi:hypothetical protein
MGFLKKITRPISRALDKIVPNEIKPALPFLAAAAPFLAPGIMGTSMLQRALVSGGLNLGSQLAQEGSDGDFSALSLAMASGIGALSAPGTPGVEAGGPGNMYGGTPGTPSAADYFSGKAAGMDPGFAKSGLGALEKSSNYLTGVGETLRTNPFSMEGLKAATVPIGQGTTDLAVAEARRAQKDYDREMADYEAGIDSENSNRAFAIRQSMEAYGFTEQEILDAIEAAGYKAGGRVGLNMGGGADFGGIPAAIQNIKEDEEETITIMTDNGPMEIQKSVYESMPGMFMDTTTSAYGDAGRGRPVPQFANGGRIGLKNGSDGSSTGSFGTDRYISEMLSEGNTLANRGENFMSEYDEMVKSGKIDSSIFDKLKEYKDMQKTEENLEKKFSNENLKNVAEENLDKDALKYYDKKVNKLEKKFDDLNEKEEDIIALTNKNQFDASEITKTPDFQNWLRVYNSEDKMKAFDHPYADIYLSILDVKLKGRNESQRDLVGLADGGRIGLQQGGVLGKLINPQAEQLTNLAGPNIGNFQPILQQAQAPVFPRLNQLEQGVSRAEETLGRVRNRLGAEKTGLSGLSQRPMPIGLQQPLNMNSLLRISGPLSSLQQQGMKDGGLMNLGGREMDMRGGGFIPIGKKERADDVPARLSKNEFVMTADAVRAAGGGSVNKGAKRMYDLMNNLEARV